MTESRRQGTETVGERLTETSPVIMLRQGRKNRSYSGLVADVSPIESAPEAKVKCTLLVREPDRRQRTV